MLFDNINANNNSNITNTHKYISHTHNNIKI